MTKIELLGVFQTAQNSCSLAYASMILWAYEDTPEYFDQLYKALDVPRPHDDVSRLIRNSEAMRVAIEALYSTAHSAALKDLFELTKSYFEENGQKNVLTAQPWYQLWRMLRNCLSHSFVLNFNEYDQRLLPVSWNGVILEIGMNGKVLTHGMFSRDKLRELLDEVARFLQQSEA